MARLVIINKSMSIQMLPKKIDFAPIYEKINKGLELIERIDYVNDSFKEFNEWKKTQIKDLSVSELKIAFKKCPKKTVIDENGHPKTIVKHIKPCIEYLKQSLFLLSTGDYVIFEDGRMVIKSSTTMNKLYFDRFPKEVKNHIKHDDVTIYSFDMLSENDNVIVGNKINTLKPIKAKRMPYKLFSDEVKELTDRMLNHIKEVWCSDNIEQYDYTLILLKRMCLGIKNNVAPYLKGIEGIGKSTPIDFLTDHVMGDGWCKGTSKQLTTGFNIGMLGRRMIVFEELPSFSIGQWQGISGVLKDLITGYTMQYESKGVDPFTCRNAHTAWILSNVEAIKNDNGRRYFILSLSTKRLGDTEHFMKMRECFRDDVGACFFNFLMEKVIEPEKFDPQKNMPMTTEKRDAIVERLDSEYKFIKEKYILKKLDMKAKVSDLTASYNNYMGMNHVNISVQKFNKKLKDVGINSYLSCGCAKVSMTYDQLHKLATKLNWLHELDDVKTKDDDDSDSEDYDNGVDKSDKSINGNMIMHAELLQLKKENEFLKLYQVFSKAKEMKSTFMRINEMNAKAFQIFEQADAKPNPMKTLRMESKPDDISDIFFNKFY